ncbi:MAG TPA: ABC transporter ATP-binding protein [Methylococcus sp.]|nr:ABC transporter ATP-binding protein [Methylococcus sp.]
MSAVRILADRVGKKFCRSRRAALYALQDFAYRAVGRVPPVALREDEFWAVQEVTLAVMPGECLGVVGPNGAGKSTLLRLLAGDYRPDTGRVEVRGAVKSLIRLGSGLQPQLTGRENIYWKCAERGLGKRDTDARLEDIVAFAELDAALDRPVRQYSDGMYARLEFAIATCTAVDVLLIDEVLAVGDIAFQVRCLDRLNALKREGTTLVFVSHAEMNMRQVADRCLLLFDGQVREQGIPEMVFQRYYEAVGYRKPSPGTGPRSQCRPADFGEKGFRITDFASSGRSAGPSPVVAGHSAVLRLGYESSASFESFSLRLEFWDADGVLVATSSCRETERLNLPSGWGWLVADLPFLGLRPGPYDVAIRATAAGCDIAYQGSIGKLRVVPAAAEVGDSGFALIEARFSLDSSDRGDRS